MARRKQTQANDPFDRASAPHDLGVLQRMSNTPKTTQVRDRSSDFVPNQPNTVTGRTGATAGRKTCTVCGKRPKSMLEHFNQQTGEGYQAHGPTSSENPHARKNLPGLKAISESLGGIFTDRRMRGY